MQALRGVLDVAAKLSLQFIDAVEAALGPQPADEANLGRLVVEISAEADQVRFDQRTLCEVIERRATTDVDCRRVLRTVRTHVPRGVDAVGRNLQVRSGGQVRGGHSDLAAAAVAESDHAPYLERPPEQPVCPLHVACAKRLADRRG